MKRKNYTEGEIKTALGTLYGSRLKEKTGQEVQFGIRRGNKGIHVGAGYDVRKPNAGIDITTGDDKRSKVYSWNTTKGFRVRKYKNK